MMKPVIRGLLAFGLVATVAYFVLPRGPVPQPVELASAATLLNAEPGFLAPDVDPSPPSMLDDVPEGTGDASLKPVALADAQDLSISVYTDASFYMDEQGRRVVDLLEQDYAYLSVIVTDGDGRAVVGAAPTFELSGTSLLLEPEKVGSRTATDASGTVDFAVIGGSMGMDTVTINVGASSTELMVNIISLRATGFPTPPVVDGGLPWNELMSAQISYGEEGMSVAFPDSVSSRADQLVKLSGFIMPLDPDIVQRRFLLTSNPPSCFFHIPGGPAGAVEVFAPEGIEASWDPVAIEGRLETLSTGEYGVIYRLHDAQLLNP